MKTVREVDQRAYHEAGHSVIATALRVPLVSVSLRETIQATPFGAVDLRKQLLVCLAGAAAERRLTGRPARYDAGDLIQAAGLVAALGAGWTVEQFRCVTDLAVEERWTQITVVARALVSRRQLSGADVRRLAILALEGEHHDRSGA